MRGMRIWACLIAGFALGCDDDPGSTSADAQPLDGFQRDAVPTPDVGGRDRGRPADMGQPDATPDRGVVDRGVPDATLDFGLPDGQVRDAAADASVDAAPQACQDNGGCDDGDPCTVNTCVDGLCAATLADGCCLDDSQCAAGTICLAPRTVCAETPVAGGLIITELMTDPVLVDDAAGEWIELLNRGATPIVLNRLILEGNAGERHVIMSPNRLEVAPGGSAVLTRNGDPAVNGGVVGVYTYAGVAMSNGGDRMALLDPNGGLLDEVIYGAGWPLRPGASLSLAPDRQTPVANDDPAAWCAGPDRPAPGADRGSPGVANPECPVPDTTIDWCRLQFPLDLVDVPAGEVLTLYGHVFEADITDLTDATDASPELIAQAGHGPAGVDPTQNPGAWDWFAADPNPGWSAAAAGEPGNDEYQTDIAAPPPGGYDFAFRFSRDRGQTWKYCDRNAGPGRDGAEDGFQSADAGHLTTVPGPCDGFVCDQPPAGRCSDRFTRIPVRAIGQCRAVDGVPTCDYPELPAEDCRAQGNFLCIAGRCEPAPPPVAAGELIISEILYDPQGALAEDAAEWIELQNVSARNLVLDGCRIGDPGASVALDGIAVPAGGFALLARTADPARNGGLVVAGTFTFALNNGGDTVTLTCGGAAVDAVVYGQGFPVARATSISLDPGIRDPAGNDDGANWCVGQAVYFGADTPDAHRGTPGAANPPCPEPDFTVDWCRLQFPLEVEAPAGGSVTVYARVFEAGVTDRSPLNDAEPGFHGEVGTGAPGTEPDALWAWTQAMPNAGWDANIANEPGNDEWQAELPVPAPGIYAFAARFTRDGGASYTLCDRNAGPGHDGAEDGYQPENAGILTSVPSPCDGVVCNAPPATSCDGDVRVVPQVPGRCEPVGDVGACTYDALREDCALQGAVCDAGACVGGAVAPAPGEIVITEIMYDTQAPLVEATSEWFELHNTAATARTLQGCEVTDAATPHPINVPLVVPADGYLIFARSVDPVLNGQLPRVDFTFPFALNNGPETLALRCGGVTIDSVAYDVGVNFPRAQRVSLSLAPGDTAVTNDQGANWCVGVDRYFAGAGAAEEHFGTPGAPNPPCAAADPCAPNPCNAPPPAVCIDELTRGTFVVPGRCAVVNGAAQCGYDPVNQPCAEGERCANGVCAAVGLQAPAAGEVIFTELMYDPHFDLLDANAEWLELTNVSAGVRALQGCILSDAGANTALGAIVLQPGQATLLAINVNPALNGGLAPAQAMGFGLGNSGERVAFTCNAVLIDELTYDDIAPWPVGAQAFSISLDPGFAHAADNDQGSHWCLGRPPYYQDPDGFAGDNHGTPGAPNPPCDVAAQFGRLQFPLSIQGVANEEVVVYGRVYHPGITDRSPATDVSPLLRAQLGYGPDGADPSVDPARFTWATAVPNPAWNSVDAGEADVDEYQVTLRLPPMGHYDYAWRFSADGGRTYVYADGQAEGSSNGYQVANAGDLLVGAGGDPCNPNPCNQPPVADCADGDTRRTFPAVGTCAAVNGAAACNYAPVLVDCLAGQTCNAGACVGGAPAPAAGEVIVTEIMYDPHFDILDANGEWIEIRNVAAEPRTLTGCTLGDPSARINIPALVLQPGGVALFANSANAALNGGLPPPVAIFAFALGNGGDRVEVSCGGVLIDSVEYDDLPNFPDAQARSLSLDPASYDAAANDDGAHWCLGRTIYYADPDGPAGNNLGTPAADNPPCALPANFGRLQFPLEIRGAPEEVVTVFGRVYHPGITDRTTATDPSPLLRAQLGYGPDGSDPEANPAAWTWLDAVGNQGYDGNVAGERDNDEYLFNLHLPVPGTYDYAWRFSADGGFAWRYADGQPAGSSDGYQAANAGNLVVGNVAARVSREGQLVFTELHYAPRNGLSDFTAEWMEIYNTQAGALDLTGCHVENEARTQAPLDGVVVPGNGYLLLARTVDPTTNGGLQPAATFPFNLRDNRESLSLVCRFEIDRVTYDDGVQFPMDRGAAIQLDPARADGRLNDQGAYWCLASAPYFQGAQGSNLGTPGAPNRDCGPLQAFTVEGVQRLFDVHCAGCHVSGAVTEGLSLDNFLTPTVGVPSVQLPSMPLITRGDHLRSYLWYKLSGEHFNLPGAQGVWMPPGQVLPASTVERFRLFIDGL